MKQKEKSSPLDKAADALARLTKATAGPAPKQREPTIRRISFIEKGRIRAIRFDMDDFIILFSSDGRLRQFVISVIDGKKKSMELVDKPVGREDFTGISKNDNEAILKELKENHETWMRSVTQHKDSIPEEWYKQVEESST